MGAEVLSLLSQGGYSVKGALHAQLDITKGMEVSIWMERLHPDVVINCAALTDVDYCEKNPEEAFRVNAEGVKNICLPLLEDVRAKLIHVSTDYVFDGKKESPYVETDPVNPLSHYAESKLKGEEYVQKLLPDAVILRVQWLYGKHGKGFASQMVRAVTQKAFSSPYALLKDRVGCPSAVHEIAKAIRAVMMGDLKGLYHFSSQGACSWLEFGKAIFELNGVESSDRYIKAMLDRDLKRSAKRPLYTAFLTEKFEKATGYPTKSWKEQLAEVIQQHLGTTSN